MAPPNKIRNKIFILNELKIITNHLKPYRSGM